MATTRLHAAVAGLLVLLTAAAWVSPRCANFAVGIGEGPEVPTPVTTSAGEVCEITEESEDGDAVISGYHDDFADYALWVIEQLTEGPEAITAQDRELIAYLEDCLAEKLPIIEEEVP